MSASSLLAKMLQEKKVPHLLLFTGVACEEHGERFAQDVLCLEGEKHRKKLSSNNHPDLHIYKPEGKTAMHAAKSIKQLLQEVYMKPFEALWKVFLIYDAERMLPSNANALLKTFEEPPPFTLIILLTEKAEKILPTIRSRCQTLNFSQIVEKPIFSDLLDFLSGTLTKEEFSAKYQEKAYSDSSFQKTFFETVMLWFRDRWLLEMQQGERFLSFPDRVDQIKKTALKPLDQVEKLLQDLRKAMERSLKFSVCLDYLVHFKLENCKNS